MYLYLIVVVVVVLFMIVTCVYTLFTYIYKQMYRVHSKYAQPIWAYKSLIIKIHEQVKWLHVFKVSLICILYRMYQLGMGPSGGNSSENLYTKRCTYAQSYTRCTMLSVIISLFALKVQTFTRNILSYIMSCFS